VCSIRSFVFSSSSVKQRIILTQFSDTLPIVVGEEVGADFSPVLNVPALSSFLVVAAIFLFLQIRIAMIGRAADQRTEALEELRSVKKLELVGRTTPDEVQRALNKYRETYDRVEELRTVVPGARIAPPPSQSLSRERMEDNVKGARQFLSIDPEPSEEKDDKTDKSLPLPLVLLLAAVAASQIGLLVLLSVDPVTGKGIFDAIDAIPGFPNS
jgi:hypothetical protein